MTEELPFCECGCGERVKNKGNRYIVGHNQIGNKASPKTRSKMTKSAKNRPPISEDTREKMRDSAKARCPPSEEALENMRKSQRGKNIGKNNPMFGKTGKDSPNYGKKHKHETIKKMSESAMGKNNVMFGRFGIDNPMYGIPRPPELCKRLSDANIDNPKLSGKSIVMHHYIYDHTKP